MHAHNVSKIRKYRLPVYENSTNNVLMTLVTKATTQELSVMAFENKHL